jgi:hypothetical protein
MGGNSVTEPKPSADWERIEAEYRAGVLSLREIASLHPGTNHVAIARRAKKEKWPRDLRARIDARAQELVTQAAVTRDETRVGPVTEREVVESNARHIANVKASHQVYSGRLLKLGITLMSELEQQTASAEDLQTLGELMRAPDERGTDKLNDIYRRVIATPGRIDSGKKVAEMLKIAVGMDRESNGIEPGKPGEGGDAPAAASRILTDAERASRLASILERARQRAGSGDAA